ncbi:MAG: hypothetical protein NTY17_04715 [Planctomycetia bacterium]|nr:hypothetical protein [Planctomycetia bacterium]
MEQAFAQHPDSLRSRCFRDRWPIVAALAVQGSVAAYLCFLKLIADAQLPPGQKYFSIFYHLLATVDWAGALLGFVFLVAAFLLPPQRWIDDLTAWLGRQARLVAVGVAVALMALSVVAQHAYPLTMDEYAPTFQSQVFARGRLTAQWPAEITPLLVAPQNVGWFFAVSKSTGQACSEYWPGHAILMTPFTFLGIPWALNPALSGCAVLLVAAVARRAFGERAAGWAVLFTLASPVFAAYGISFYAMTSHLTLNLLFAWLLLTPTVARVAGAGLVGGFALALHNPFPHLVFALPWLGWLAVRPDRWTRLPLIGLCYAAVFLPIEVGWRRVEESVRGNGPVAVAPAANDAATTAASQATADAPPSPPAAPAGAASIVGAMAGYFSALQLPSFDDLWQGRMLSLLRLVAWDAPGLLVIAFWGFWTNRRSTAARLFGLSGLSTFFGYALISASGGHGWGYRYFFSAWSCLPILASGLAADRTNAEPDGASVTDVLRAAGLAAVLSLAICLPVRLWQIHAVIVDHVSQMPPQPADMEIVQGDVVSFVDPKKGHFRNDLIRNHPFFEHGPYVLVSTGFENDKLVIAKLAEAVGMQARMTAADDRGSTWVVQPAPPQEPTP